MPEGSVLRAPAAGRNGEPQVVCPHPSAVLSQQVEEAVGLAGAEVARVDQQALAAALHVEDELAHRHVRGVVEHGFEATVRGADHAAQLDRNLAVQVDQHVRQRVAGRGQVDRALEHFVEQRRACLGVPIDRVLRAFLGGQLDPRADRLDVTLIEDRRPRQDERRAAQVGVAAAGFDNRPEPRVGGPLGRVLAAEDLRKELRLELQRLAFSRPEFVRGLRFKPGARVGRVAAAAEDPRADLERFATGRGVDGEVRAVDRDVDRADVELHPAEYVWNRVGDGMDFGRFGVDVDRRPHRHRAEVIRAGDGGRDEQEADRSPFVRSRQVDLARRVERRRAGAGGDVHGSDEAVGRAARGGLLGFAGGFARRRDARLGAVFGALQLRHHAGRQVDIDLADLLRPVRPGDVQIDRAVLARLGPGRSGFVGRAEGTVGERFRTRSAAGAFGQREFAAWGCVWVARPWSQCRGRLVRAASVGSGQGPFWATVDVDLEGAERRLRIFVDDHFQLAGIQVGEHVPDQTHVHAVAFGAYGEKDPELFAGGRVVVERRGGVDGAAERVGWQRGGLHLGGADLRRCGALDRIIGVVTELRVAARLESVGQRWIEPRAFRQGYSRRLQVRVRDRFFGVEWD